MIVVYLLASWIMTVAPDIPEGRAYVDAIGVTAKNRVGDR
jgi:hypothetical protein